MAKYDDKSEVVIGVDIGGTNTAIGLVEVRNENLLLRTSLPTLAHEPASKFVARLSNNINDIFKDFSGKYVLRGIGIAAPAANYYQGTLESPSNFSWGKVKLVQMMKENYDVPVFITNDAKAAALGEMIYGEAKNLRNFIVITLGTGLGCGIVINRELIQGENGLAGELGHVVVEPNGRHCQCGRRGCLETYVSANGLCRTAFELICDRLEESELQNFTFKELTPKKIFELAQKEDFLAVKAFNYTGRILGEKLADAVATFSPEAIILFGGVMQAGELLLKSAKQHFEENLLDMYEGQVTILQSQLKNGEAAILGACAFIINEIKNIGSKKG
jgi:glucokinase